MVSRPDHFPEAAAAAAADGETAASNEICVSRSPSAAVAFASQRDAGGTAGRGPPGHSTDRPKSKFVVGKTVQMSPEHATRSFLRRLPPSLDRRRDRRRRGKREEGRKDGLHHATEVIREGRRAHRRKEDDEFAVSPLLLLPSSSSASSVRLRRVRAIK